MRDAGESTVSMTEANEEICVEIGTGNVVRIDKLYGPWAVSQIRLRLDYDPGEWVVEREDDPLMGKWVEVARFAAEGECCDHRCYTDGKGGTLPCDLCGESIPP